MQHHVENGCTRIFKGELLENDETEKQITLRDVAQQVTELMTQGIKTGHEIKLVYVIDTKIDLEEVQYTNIMQK